MRELYEVIDKRIADAIGGRPVTLLRGQVIEVAPTGYRLAAIIDGQSEGTPDIPYDLALQPAVDDDVLMLRRSDGLLFAFAILRRGELAGIASPEAVEVFIACKAPQSGNATGADSVWVTMPLTTTGGWDTDSMYVAPDDIVVHHSGLYKVRAHPPYFSFTGGSPTGYGYDCRLLKNGAALFAVNTLTAPGYQEEDVWLDAGDALTLEARGRTSSGTPPTLWTYEPRTDSGLEVLAYVVQSTTRTYGPEPVGAVAYHDTTQSVASGVVTTLALDSEDWDTDGYHSDVTNDSRLTVPAGKSGMYRITARAAFAANVNGYRDLWVEKNGTTRLCEQWENWPHASIQTPIDLDVPAVYLTAGDYVELRAYQTSGASLDVGVGGGNRHWQTELAMVALTTYPTERTEAPDRSIGARVAQTAATSLSASTWTAVAWGKTYHDTDGFWTAALPARFTVPANAPAGVYRCTATIRFMAANAGSDQYSHWRKNGEPTSGAGIGRNVKADADGTAASGIAPTTDFWLSPGDHVEVWAMSTGACDVGNAAENTASSDASITYLGSGSAATQAVLGTEVTRSTAQSIGATTAAAISWDAASPSLGWWAASPDPTRVTVDQTGWYGYEVGAKLAAPTTAGVRCYLKLEKNGSTELANSEADTTSGQLTLLHTSGQVYLSAGDYVRASVYNGDPAAKDTSTGAYLRLVRLANGSEATVDPMVVQDAPGAKVRRTSSFQSIPNASSTELTYDTAEYDSHGFWAAGQPGRFTIPAGHGGLYEASIAGSWETVAVSRFFATLRKNGTEQPGCRVADSDATDVGHRGAYATWTLMLAAGDYVDAVMWQTNSGSASRQWGGSNTTQPVFSITRLASGPQGPKGDPGADVFAEVTDWPTSPTEGQVVRHLSLDRMLFRWNGSYWLSEQKFAVVADIPNLANQTQSQQYRAVVRGPGNGSDGWWLERSYWRYYRADTTAYFTVSPYWGTTPTGALATWNSSGVTGWGVFKTEHGFYRARDDASNGHYEVSMTQIGTFPPGTLHALLVSTEYRLAYAGT